MKTLRFFLLSILFLPLVSLAQSIPGIANPVSIVMTPTNPGPGDTITLSAESSSFDVNSAVLTWTANGSVVTKGTGQKTITLSAGALGKKTTIGLSASVPSLGTFTDSLVINPAVVDLIWEAQTSVPPFYQGKALLGWGGTYKVVAVPEVYENGAAVDPSKLIYTWSKNYSVDASESGYGKNVYQSDGSINYTRGGDTIGVTVATSDGAATAQGSITVSPVSSSILLYLDDPLYGVLYNQSLAQTTLSGSSVSFRAEPLFFSDLSSAIGSLSWTMNGSAVSDFAGNPSLTLVRQDKTAGTSVIEASLNNPYALLQGAQESVTININAEQ